MKQKQLNQYSAKNSKDSGTYVSGYDFIENIFTELAGESEIEEIEIFYHYGNSFDGHRTDREYGLIKKSFRNKDCTSFVLFEDSYHTNIIARVEPLENITEKGLGFSNINSNLLIRASKKSLFIIYDHIKKNRYLENLIETELKGHIKIKDFTTYFDLGKVKEVTDLIKSEY